MKNIEILAGFLPKELSRVKRIPRKDLKAFLKESQAFDIKPSSKPSSPQIQFYSKEEIAGCMIADFLKYYFASMQTITKIHDTFKNKNVSWAIIETYYSSFYAAQALMRISGYYYSHIDAGLKDAINSSSFNVANGVSVDIGTGTYDIYVNFNNSELEMTLLTKANSHQDVWDKFYKFLDNVIMFSTKEYQSESNDFNEQLEAVNFILRGGRGKPYFLSNFRNDVNYLKKTEYWYPFKGISSDCFRGFKEKGTYYKKSSESIRVTAVDNPGLNELQLVSCFLISLIRETATYLQVITKGKIGTLGNDYFK